MRCFRKERHVQTDIVRFAEKDFHRDELNIKFFGDLRFYKWIRCNEPQFPVLKFGGDGLAERSQAHYPKSFSSHAENRFARVYIPFSFTELSISGKKGANAGKQKSDRLSGDFILAINRHMTDDNSRFCRGSQIDVI